MTVEEAFVGSVGAAPRDLEVVPVLVPPPPSDDGRKRRQLLGQGLVERTGVGPFLRAGDAVVLAAAASIGGLTLKQAPILVTAVVLLLGWLGLYRSRLTLSVLTQAPPLVLVPTATAAMLGALDAFHTGDIRTVRSYLTAGAASGVLVVLGRILAFATLRAVRRRGFGEHRVLVLGAGQVALRLVKVLEERREFGLRPVAVWDREPLLGERAFGVPVVGEEEGLASVIRGHRASVVVIAFTKLPESGVVDVVRTCDRLDCEIFVVPRLFELHHRSSTMDEVRGIPLMRLRRAAYRTRMWQIKRVFDVVVSACLIGVLAPVFAACALAVRWEGRGKTSDVLFRQRRIGRDGRPFQLLKFRSLLPADENESAILWNIAHDHRVGPVGKFLRRSSLDELPQFWNVLRGDMTLVGPRPERPHFVERFTVEFPSYVARHRVPAGVTGWAQIHGLRGDTSIEERAAFDNYYIENWSLWLDVIILLRTVGAVFSRAGS